MQDLTSQEELAQLLRNRPSETHTYQLSRGVVVDRSADAGPLRLMTTGELEELANYLKVSPAQLQGEFLVADTSCDKCKRRLTILDFVKTAVDKGHHGLAELAGVLSGVGGDWVTVRGKDGGRPVDCAGCGESITSLRSSYSEYSGGGYAYA